MDTQARIRNYTPTATHVGSVFVSNYPPYRTWGPDAVQQVLDRFDEPPRDPDMPLGLYVHIPFCRQRCDFCWYKVHTGGEHTRHVRAYLDTLGRELEHYASLPAFRGRSLECIHFGGGTPSMIATKHLGPLFERLKGAFSWDAVSEVTFECEPGTLTNEKVEVLRELGVTRISLGVQNFSDEILRKNNRAHSATESISAYHWLREAGFPHVSIDLLCGMPGESETNWFDTVAHALELEPDAVSVYQMEVPGNTKYARQLADGAEITFADWPTKLTWAAYAFDAFCRNGYVITDSRSLIKQKKRRSVSPSRYQDVINTGADLIAIGASPFGTVDSVQYQNEKHLGAYLDTVSQGSLPVVRGVEMDARTRFIREFTLQLKTGSVERRALREKFSLDPVDEFPNVITQLCEDGMLERPSADTLVLTRTGILQADFWIPLFHEQ